MGTLVGYIHLRGPCDEPVGGGQTQKKKLKENKASLLIGMPGEVGFKKNDD